MMFNRSTASLIRKLGSCRINSNNRALCIGVALAVTVALPTVARADDTVILKSGDRLSGAIVERTEATIVLQHSVLGRVEIPTAQVAELISAPAPDATDAEGGEVVQKPLARPQDESGFDIEDTPAELKPAKPEWKSHFTFGADLQYGLTDEQDVSFGIQSIRENERLKTRIESGFDFGINNGERDDNAFYAAVQQDWFIPDTRWFYYVQGRFDYDEFDSWEERLAAHGGVGFFLVRRPDDFTMAARFGVGGVKEWGSEDEDLRPEGMLGLELHWTITDQQSIEARGVFYPWLDDLFEYRTMSDVRWRYRFTDESNMALSAGLRHEYESTTDPGIDHHDLRIVLGIDFDF